MGGFFGLPYNLPVILRPMSIRRGNYAHVVSPTWSGQMGAISASPTTRTCVWFSGDATPYCAGCASWATRKYSADPTSEFIRPSIPDTRETPHIGEVGF